MSAIAPQILDQEPLTADTWLDNLDQMEALFVLRYVETMNVRQAAIDAGYAVSVAITKAYGWVSKSQSTKPHVLAAIDFDLKRRENQVLVTRDMWTRRARAIAFADPRKALRWGMRKVEAIDESDERTDGAVVIRETTIPTVEIIPSDELDDDTAAAIKSIKQDKDGSISYEFHPPVPALTLLGKHLGYLTDSKTIRFEASDQRQPVDAASSAKVAAEAWSAMLDDDE